MNELFARTTTSVPRLASAKSELKAARMVSVSTNVPTTKATPSSTARAVATKRNVWARSPRNVTRSIRARYGPRRRAVRRSAMSSRRLVRLTAMPSASIATALARHVDDGDVPGLVAVVGRGNDLDVTVLGDQTIGGPAMREDSLFRIASIGKPITAAATLALVADGRLGLDDPVDDLLPELASPRVVRTLMSPVDDTVPAERAITVADLLRSTNGHGFPSDFSAPVAGLLFERLLQGPPEPQQVPAPDEWMARLGEIPLLHQPGEGFTYNTAFDILAVLIARASGRSFPEHLAARILRPLGMDETGFAFPAGTTDRATSLYRRGDDGELELKDGPTASGRASRRSRRAPVAWCRRPPTSWPSSGCCSTAAGTCCRQRSSRR